MSTEIQWTDETWNPIRAYDRETGKRGWFCVKVSQGCRGCYAEGMNRWRGNGLGYTVGNLDEVRIELHERTLVKPFHWREPRRVFPCSMTDLFLDAHSDEMIDQVFAVMALTPQHTYQVLTKRAARMREYMTAPNRKRVIAAATAAVSDMLAREAESHAARVKLDHFSACFAGDGPFPNVWLGVSTENQDAADERIPQLVQTPAAVRFLSCEPLLGRIDFDRAGSLGPEVGDPFSFSALRGADGVEPPIPGIDWVIVGGESGPTARPCSIDNVGRIIYQCRSAGVPCFVKQLGAHPFEEEVDGHGPELGLRDSHGGDPSEWPPMFRVREFPAVRA